MHQFVNSQLDFDLALDGKLVVFYFSSESCSVCRSLLPQLKRLLDSTFPEIILYQISSEHNTALCAEKMVFTFPTLLIYVEGKEALRFSRIIPLGSVSESLVRFRNLLSD